jgi:DNA-binding transcriptional MerR regulator
MMIGELAARSGLSPSCIRFYEANGLLPGAHRRANGYREFKPQSLQILEFIRFAQQAGFTLDEIRTLLPTDLEMGTSARDKMLDTLRCKISGIEALQQQLEKNKAQLRAIVDVIENRPNGMTCLANMGRAVSILRG